jgi:glycine/D-amino acid oxidase-like deaminating enzyme
MTEKVTEYFDVLIVGAGISGIGGAYHLERNRPAGPRRPGRRLAVHDSSAGSNMTVGGW